MDVNSRRHHAFMTSKKSWPPNTLHQDLKMLDVDWEGAGGKGHGRCVDDHSQ